MTEYQKRLPVWPVFIVLFMILFFFILRPACRYVYTRHFVTRSDEQLAEILADNLETAGITSLDKPIFFIGSGETRTNASCLDLSDGKYDIYSIFAAADAMGLDTLEASRYIVEHLNEMGYSYTSPNAENWISFEDEISSYIPLEKAFPWYESILETEHFIIVQLSHT